MEERTDTTRSIESKFKLGRLTLKIGALVISLIIGALFAFSSVFTIFERGKVSEDIVNNGRVFAEFSSGSLYRSYLDFYTRPGEDDFAKFKDQSQEILSKNRDIREVSLIGINGRILFSTSELTNGKYTGLDDRIEEDQEVMNLVQKEEISELNRDMNGERETEIVVPLKESSGDHVLSMRYVLTYSSLNQRMLEIYLRIGLTVIPLLLLSIILSILLSIKITDPILKLIKATRVIREGNFNVHIKPSTNDEIGLLASSFNQMANDLKKSHAENEKYKRELEHKVAERTKQLDAKVQELEGLNKFMIGREVRMVELKEQIVELKKNNGAKTPTPKETKKKSD